MLDSELTEPGSRTRGGDVALDAAELGRFHELFMTLCRLRACSPSCVDALFVQRQLGVSPRHGARHLKQLVAAGYLARMRLTGGRVVYHLTRRALLAVPGLQLVGRDVLRRPPAFMPAHYCWLRSELIGELVRDGFTVGRSALERATLRRFLVERQRAVVAKAGKNERREAEGVLAALRASDALRVSFRAVCRACGWKGDLDVKHDGCAKCGAAVRHVAPPRLYACRRCGRLDDAPTRHTRIEGGEPLPCDCPMPELDVVACDVAWRETRGAGLEVRLLIVDDPSKSLEKQLRALPLSIAGQPAVPVILRSTDTASQFNGRSGGWHCVGGRHRALLQAFTGDGLPGVFPFSLTTSVIDCRPGLELWRVL